MRSITSTQAPSESSDPRPRTADTSENGTRAASRPRRSTSTTRAAWYPAETASRSKHTADLRAQVVTVSDIDGFARAGGMVELAQNPDGSGALSILINRRAAQEQRVQFNAQLLRLATIVEP